METTYIGNYDADVDTQQRENDTNILFEHAVQENSDRMSEALVNSAPLSHINEDAPVADKDASDNSSVFDTFIKSDLQSENVPIENNNLDSKPIYTGHTMTVWTSVTLIWIYALTHSITASQLSDLLVLINIHCMDDIPVLSSVERFKKYFADMKTPITKHYFCFYCNMNVLENTDICPNTFCSKDLKKAGSKSYFLELPINQQLKTMYERPDFRENLKHKFKRSKKNIHGIEDIYDGQIYKKLSAPGGPLSMPNNISFTWNTDGVPVFKSSKFSLWPMYLMINELPYKMRKEKANMLFYGLWFGEKKPEINLFCEPLLKCLSKLETEGLNVSIDGTEINVKGFLICGTADLPAKCTVLNMTQFNGKYSCSRCLQEGKTEKIGLRGHTHIYPFIEGNPTGPARQHTHTKFHANQATQNYSAVFGIKGPSFLMGLKSYDYVYSTSIDYMHCVLLGLTKRLMSLWFSATNSKEIFSLTKKSDFVDKCLVMIKPPYQITRRPRSVSEHFKYWKASELRAWLFFYSLPILSEIMQPAYFFHYCAFVQGIWYLCQDSLTCTDIQKSYKLLSYFVYMMKPLYGARYCTLNTHSLLHLPQCVQDLGPLWVYSCFPFESLNGDLLKLFHGTQHVDTQILSAVKCHQVLPNLLDKLPANVHNSDIVKKFNKSKTKLGIRMDHDVITVGKMFKYMRSNKIKKSLANFLGHDPFNLKYYRRMHLRGMVVHSKMYTRVEARNSYTVKFLDGTHNICFGVIDVFGIHQINECDCINNCWCEKVIFALVTKFEKVRESVINTADANYPIVLGLNVEHIHVMKTPNNAVVEVVEIHNIMSLCVDVHFSDIHYICEFPNLVECD